MNKLNNSKTVDEMKENTSQLYQQMSNVNQMQSNFSSDNSGIIVNTIINTNHEEKEQIQLSAQQLKKINHDVCAMLNTTTQTTIASLNSMDLRDKQRYDSVKSNMQYLHRRRD